jgi:hypothetical protein
MRRLTIVRWIWQPQNRSLLKRVYSNTNFTSQYYPSVITGRILRMSTLGSHWLIRSRTGRAAVKCGVYQPFKPTHHILYGVWTDDYQIAPLEFVSSLNRVTVPPTVHVPSYVDDRFEVLNLRGSQNGVACHGQSEPWL